MKLSTGKAFDMKAIFGLLVLCFILFLDQNLVSAKKNHYLIETDGKGIKYCQDQPQFQLQLG